MLLFKFGEHLSDIILGSKSYHNIQLFQFDINWIVVFDKEYFHFMLKDICSFLNDLKQ
jgi:hypothetical protein